MIQKEDFKAACKTLVLDAGPLLSLSPLRGLAERYVTVPQVLLELKDKDAREHFERLGLTAGVSVEIQDPDAASLLEVTQTARKTGDYGVLSTADLRILALTLTLDKRAKEEQANANTLDQPKPFMEQTPGSADDDQGTSIQETDNVLSETAVDDITDNVQAVSLGDKGDATSEACAIEITVGMPLEAQHADGNVPQTTHSPNAVPSFPPSKRNNTAPQTTVVFEDPSDSDDGEGEWITPSNVGLHKSRALDLLPSSESSDPFTMVTKKKGKKSRKLQDNGIDMNVPSEQMGVGCMTADFAMQNVLLQMGLNLVSVEGKRIQRVKNWVLRCHACFKICKDNSRKFCPSCGNPTLLRTSVTISAPNASGSEPVLQVHLKKNFVYRNRGMKYSIPAPQPGSSKTGSRDGLILREDQSEYMRAQKRVDGQREKQEKKMLRDTLKANADGTGVKLGNWSDPDWMPELLSIGTGGKGRKMADSRIGPDGMPIVGYGRKNPNERKRKT